MDRDDALSLALVVLLAGFTTWRANREDFRALYELAREVKWPGAVAAAVVAGVLLCAGVAVLLTFA